ncbi:phosphotransferase family protein [Orenia marismortui]|uniref:phosphotransferase family protein n=1 Tax=Orenia marismortui TaxID=46469 RepID=UPI000376C66C|nr:aminoglycoside phosphotransferase family protein [Orenia marismortui]
MQSITKTKLRKEEVIRLTQEAFGRDVKLEKIRELTDGFFNTAYMIDISEGPKTVLKVSPVKDVQVMRYENNLMKTEVFALNEMYKSEGIPVPKVLYYDSSGEIIDSEFFFMEFVSGSSLDKIREQLTEQQYNAIYLELGKIVKKINMIRGDYFGHISQENKRFSTWAEAFLNMIKDLLDDAKDVRISFSYKNDKLYDILNEQRDILNQVKTPSLVHKDLWEGNIFVDPKSAQITGIVDCERALFGDPLLEAVCGFLMRNNIFMDAYMGKDSLSKDEEIRCMLYKIYLYLIMIIESTYRQYKDKSIANWARSELNNTLNDLIEIKCI